MKLRKIGLASALALGLSGVGSIVAVPAHAAVVTCGQTITQDTILDADVGPCSVGIVIGADNITFDLNGHTIRGGTPAATGQPGILIERRTGVTVRNGTVREFGAGVSLESGTTNTLVTRMILQDNLGNGDYGDGVTLFGSGTTRNTITGNIARHNGPYDGIGLISGASGNTISNNLVENNNTSFQDAGIRIEGPGSKNNIITGNTVRGSTIDGIEAFGFTNTNSGSIITRNVVTGNGRHGIVLFRNPAAAGASDSTVSNNIVQNNRGDGILVQSLNNTLNTNRVSGSGRFDLQDTNPNCDNNAWRGNTGATFTPPCVLTP